MGQNSTVVDKWEDRTTTVVNFSSDTYSNPFRHKYVIKLAKGILSKDITLIFPNFHNKFLRVSDYYRITSLTKEINYRLSNSTREGIILYVLMDDQLYALDGIVGRLYLVWAECLNRKTINQQTTPTDENVPLFIEMNGKAAYRSIYILGMHECINCGECEVIEPIDTTLFCLEEDPRKSSVKSISTISNSKADEIARTVIARDLVSMDLEEPPFPSEEE